MTQVKKSTMTIISTVFNTEQETELVSYVQLIVPRSFIWFESGGLKNFHNN